MEDLAKREVRQRSLGMVLEMIDEVTIEVPREEDGQYGYSEKLLIDGARMMKAAIQKKIIGYMLTVYAGYHEGASQFDELELPWEIVGR